jgi:hypothetical protein
LFLEGTIGSNVANNQRTPSTGVAMPHQPPWRSRLTRCAYAAAFLLMITAATTSLSPMSHAAEPAAAAETPVGPGPLTPVRREPPAVAAQSVPSQKQTTAAKKPAIAMPPAASTSAGEAPTTPAQPDGKPQSKQTEQATSPAPTPKAAKSQLKQAAPGAISKTEKAQLKQAEDATSPRPRRKAPPTKTVVTTTEQAETKAIPAERRTRSTEIVEQSRRRERVYRDAYGWPEDEPYAYRGARPYAPPPVYGEVPGEMGPVPFRPPWSYRDRSFAWGPYPGMGFPRGPW